jgi:hypothetical protein
MGQKQELKDQKPESSVEHEIKSSSTSEAGQLPADSHDTKQLETDPPDSESGVHPQGPSQEAFIDERRESTYISLIHKFSHPAPNMRETTDQPGVPSATLVKQRAMH